MTPIRNIINGKRTKNRWYEVAIMWSANEYDRPDIVAKFKAEGDARAYANQLADTPVYKHEILIR